MIHLPITLNIHYNGRKRTKEFCSFKVKILLIVLPNCQELISSELEFC